MANVCVLTDENGNEIARREYDAFGNVLSETGDWSQTRFGFNTNWMELKDSGGRFVVTPGGRIYDKQTGRFLQRDPVPNATMVNNSAAGAALGQWQNSPFAGVVAGAPIPGQGPPNPYIYANSNPVGAVDATGLQPQEFVDAWAEAIGMAGTVGYMSYQDVAHFTDTLKGALPPGVPGEVTKFALDMAKQAMLNQAIKDYLEKTAKCSRCGATAFEIKCPAGGLIGAHSPMGPGALLDAWKNMNTEDKKRLAKDLGNYIEEKFLDTAKKALVERIAGKPGVEAMEWKEWAESVKKNMDKSIFK